MRLGPRPRPRDGGRPGRPTQHRKYAMKGRSRRHSRLNLPDAAVRPASHPHRPPDHRRRHPRRRRRRLHPVRPAAHPGARAVRHPCCCRPPPSGTTCRPPPIPVLAGCSPAGEAASRCMPATLQSSSGISASPPWPAGLLRCASSSCRPLPRLSPRHWATATAPPAGLRPRPDRPGAATPRAATAAAINLSDYQRNTRLLITRLYQ
jgi:hypothetical protein